jgi:hypothetical protein
MTLPKIKVGQMESPKTTILLIAVLAVVFNPVLSADSNCIGNTNEDDLINIEDLLTVLSAWGTCNDPCVEDLDDSGVVDNDDVLSVITAWGPCETAKSEVLFDLDFEHRTTGTYNESMLEEDWNTPLWSQGVEEGRVSITDTDIEMNRALTVRYPKGEYGTSATGAQWKLMFGGSYECVRLSYRVQFTSPFNFVNGGKLPGLIGGEGNTGGGIPSGTDGWSARMMWRIEGAIVQYVYHPDQPEYYGEDFPWVIGDEPLFFQPGQWHDVVHEVKMNTPGLNDGSIKAWLDGELALEAESMRFRDADDFAIDGMYFSTFFGGGNSSWASTADEIVLFDDFVIEAISTSSD